MLYCLDTSVLIESWCRLYPPSSFPSFWKKFEKGIVDQHFIAPEIVLDELKKKDDDLYKWVKKRSQLFVPLNEQVQLQQRNILYNFSKPEIESYSTKLWADPWVIALAQVRKCPVVSMENNGKKNKPKIPDVCNTLGIRCLKVVDLIGEMGWKF